MKKICFTNIFIYVNVYYGNNTKHFFLPIVFVPYIARQQNKVDMFLLPPISADSQKGNLSGNSRK